MIPRGISVVTRPVSVVARLFRCTHNHSWQQLRFPRKQSPRRWNRSQVTKYICSLRSKFTKCSRPHLAVFALGRAKTSLRFGGRYVHAEMHVLTQKKTCICRSFFVLPSSASHEFSWLASRDNEFITILLRTSSLLTLAGWTTLLRT